ncbi:hypothetical protein P7C70_g368, partial [Phenoliferia sp. Uapishka_3]
MSRTAPLPYDVALTSDEAYDSVLKSINLPKLVSPAAVQPSPNVSHNPFFDAMRPSILQVHGPTVNPTQETQNLTLTDNLGVTNASTQSAPLDLFTELGSVEVSELPTLLDNAWAENPLETLRIIWNARSIPRGKGKKDPWVRGAAWLAERHPQTLLRNLDVLVKPTDVIPRKRKAEAIEGEGEAAQGDEAEDWCEVDVPLTPRNARSHGYYKDLLNILVLSSLPSATTPSASQFSIGGDYTRIPGLEVDENSPFASLRVQGKKAKKVAQEETAEVVAASEATRIDQLLSTEGGFHRALHLTVARIFGLQLQADLEALKAAVACRAANQENEALAFETHISLAAKWAPTEGGFHDKYTRITTSVAEYLTPLTGIRTSAGVVRALTIYRSQYIAPLRKHLDLVERKMSAGDWKKIKYSRVPSLAMSNLTPKFYKHDAEGFSAYLVRVAEGKSSISGAAITPAKLFKQAQRGGVEATVAEAQWKTLVSSVKDEGKLSRCIAVADVSGSMWSPTLKDDGTAPIDSSLALSVLISQVTTPPFANAIISFTDVPKFIDLTPGTLAELRAQIEEQGMGYNTDFILTFREILKRATDAHLTQEQMVERLFVFSDMEFDECHTMGNKYASHYEIVKQAYKDAGYEIPELVFWNLASKQRRTSKPVAANEPGTALVSGYSAAIVKVFLAGNLTDEEDEVFEEVEEVNEVTGEVITKAVKVEMTPLGVMRKAIGHSSFAGLQVHD